METSSFVFERGDETIKRCPSLVKECPGRQKFDGKNDVAWMPINGCCTLGVTWSGTSIDEADMALNTNFNWTADASGYNAQTVFLHENGHVVGLGHSNEIGSVMEAVYKGQRTELTQDDFDGITSLYPGGPTNYEPTVSITFLDNGATFASGETIGFAGNAADTVDGDLTGGLAWSSDLVGPIGTGESFSAVLSDGNHTITASVTDSGGKTGSASVTITVGPLPDSAMRLASLP